jgi:hypothetical protein
MLYLHVTTARAQRIASPLDRLPDIVERYAPPAG